MFKKLCHLSVIDSDACLFNSIFCDSFLLKSFSTTSFQLVLAFLQQDFSFMEESSVSSLPVSNILSPDEDASSLLQEDSSSPDVTAWGMFKLTALSNASLCSFSNVSFLWSFCTFGGVVMVSVLGSFKFWMAINLFLPTIEEEYHQKGQRGRGETKELE